MSDLPPLPFETYESGEVQDLMREYGRACEKAAYERAKQVCLDKAEASETHAEHYGCVRCAEAIEALGDSNDA